MNWELVSTLPPGSGSRTVLGRLGERFGVLRQLEAEPFYPPRAKEPTLPLLEVAVVAGLRYAVYEVVSTVSLRELIEALLVAEQMPPVGMVARVVIDAARAVASIDPPRPHGGLSDASVLVGFDGNTRLLDFGAPRISRFLAPGRASPRNDVFALGAVLHSALTGFTGHYGEAVIQGLKLPPPSLSNLEVPAALDDVLQRATSGVETERPAEAAQLADEIEAAMAGVLFSRGDIAAVVGMALATQREELARLLAGEPVPVISPAPSPARVRVEPTRALMVPWPTGPADETQPLAIALPRSSVLPLDDDEEELTDPAGVPIEDITRPISFTVTALTSGATVPEPPAPSPAIEPAKPVAEVTRAATPSLAVDDDSLRSMPALPAVAPSKDPPPRGATARKVLAAVLAALALLAVGVHEFAPNVIDSIRARLGPTHRPTPGPELEDRSPPTPEPSKLSDEVSDEDVTGPAKVREPVVEGETTVRPKRPR